VTHHTSRLLAILAILAGVAVGVAVAPESVVFLAPLAGALLLLPLVPGMTGRPTPVPVRVREHRHRP
jgi:hypothetical protein